MVGAERQHGEVQGGELREHLALALAREGRHEERLEAQLGLLAVLVLVAVHHLDGAGRGDVVVDRQQRDGGPRDDVPPAVPDGDDGRVAVGDQIDLGAVHEERFVDLDDVLALRAVGPLAVRHPGLEGPRGAALRTALLVRTDELVEHEAERGQRVGVVERARLEVVVLGERVGEAVALDDQLAALGLEKLPGGEGHQHHDQGDVEDQVPGLAEVALLGGDRVTHLVHPEAPLAQDRESRRADLVGLGPGAPGGVRGQPGQPLRRARRAAAQLAHELAGARHDAADERDEQQDVDRGEPHRAVHVEKLELLVDRGEGGVLFLEGLHLHVVDAGLGDQRPRDGPEGEQEEQDQRHPHRGQLTPEPARPADHAHRGHARPGVGALLAGRGGELVARRSVGGAPVALVLALPRLRAVRLAHELRSLQRSRWSSSASAA
ncbi:hypothetical protein Sgri01_04667 [Streptomyces griseus]